MLLASTRRRSQRCQSPSQRASRGGQSSSSEPSQVERRCLLEEQRLNSPSQLPRSSFLLLERQAGRVGEEGRGWRRRRRRRVRRWWWRGECVCVCGGVGVVGSFNLKEQRNSCVCLCVCGSDIFGNISALNKCNLSLAVWILVGQPIKTEQNQIRPVENWCRPYSQMFTGTRTESSRSPAGLDKSREDGESRDCCSGPGEADCASGPR